MTIRGTLLITAIWLASTPALAGTAGFTRVEIADGSGPPIEAGIWYPADGLARSAAIGLFTQMVAEGAPVAGRDLPMVILSHGSGGDFAGHGDTALALARAGFIAVAPTHTGDNYRDHSRALDVAGRARQISVVIDYMVGSWAPRAIDPGRLGAFGFSAGGLSVLVAAGGTPDLRRVGPHCAAHPSAFECRLVAAHAGEHPAPPPTAFPHDRRIRAIVVAAPALGYAFDRKGIEAVRMPVQLWRAGDDTILPDPFSAEAVRLALPTPPEFHVVPGAGHFDFLAPCPAAPGFDRTAFHRRFDDAVVAFFVRTLRRSER